MKKFDYRKYPAYPALKMASRRWPDAVIKQAPIWCSVDLRDGNQALIEPMTPAQKSRLYDQLVAVGFKEIEVGFPSASTTDYEFVRELLDNDRVPEDVTLQVLTQARPELIEKTFESLRGARRAILHLYNSTSTVQREKVFQLDRDGIINIAVEGAKLVLKHSRQYPGTEWVFEYSPESFTGTEMDYAVEVCNAVIQVWQPTPNQRCIINLPATVEMSTPNVYADQIEYFCARVDRRDSILVSTHTHNDRGCAVAASELALMAGAERVEGTLLGNGERTGNMDIMTMAMNLYSQGIDPTLDFEDMDQIVQTYRECTQLPVHPRHPYAGELVFTAFSGSHQDAIKKCLDKYDDTQAWQVAYLPIDPEDIGRSYQEVVRINSQSGKGGIAYVLERDYNLQLPRWLQIDFSSTVQRHAEKTETEVAPDVIWELFQSTYFSASGPWKLGNYQISRESKVDKLQAELIKGRVTHTLSGSGSGVVEAFTKSMALFIGKKIVLVEYSEHALSHSADAEAICYIQLNIEGQRVCGVGRSADIIQASLDAILGAINVAVRAEAEYAA